MKHFRIFAVLVLVLALALVSGGCGKSQEKAPSNPSINMKEGQWEMTIATDMAGAPAQSYTDKVCLTKKDIIPQQQKDDPECKKEIKTSGNTVTMNLACKDINMTSVYIWSGEAFEGKNQLKMNINGKETVTNSTHKGKYLGPCPPGQQQPGNTKQ